MFLRVWFENAVFTDQHMLQYLFTYAHVAINTNRRQQASSCPLELG